jgi:hypothetical protein
MKDYLEGTNLTPEHVEMTMNDVHDVLEGQREIEDAIANGGQLMQGGILDEELEKELDFLVEKTTTGTPVAKAAASTALESMEEDIADLLAELPDIPTQKPSELTATVQEKEISAESDLETETNKEQKEWATLSAY